MSCSFQSWGLGFWGKRWWEACEPDPRAEENAVFCVGPALLSQSRPGLGPGAGEVERSGLPPLLCLARGGGRVRGMRSRDRVVDGGGVGSQLPAPPSST